MVMVENEDDEEQALKLDDGRTFLPLLPLSLMLLVNPVCVSMAINAVVVKAQARKATKRRS